MDIYEFFIIHEFINKLKENIFKENMEQFKYCVNNVITFTNENINQNKLNEKEKIIIFFLNFILKYK